MSEAERIAEVRRWLLYAEEDLLAAEAALANVWRPMASILNRVGRKLIRMTILTRLEPGTPA